MKINYKLIGGLLGGLALSLGAQVASAYTLTYTGGNYTLCATGTVNSQPALVASVTACNGGTAATEQYKAEVDPAGESGPFASSYSTEFFNSATDPSDATISYTGGPSIACSTTNQCFLGVKDGNHNPTYYVFNISDWNGTSALVMRGFWPGRGAISNVSIWGGGSTSVPEPSMLGLLGLGILGLGLSGRRKLAK